MRIVKTKKLRPLFANSWTRIRETRDRDVFNLFDSMELGEYIRITNEYWRKTGRYGDIRNYRGAVYRWFKKKKFRFQNMRDNQGQVIWRIK